MRILNYFFSRTWQQHNVSLQRAEHVCRGRTGLDWTGLDWTGTVTGVGGYVGLRWGYVVSHLFSISYSYNVTEQ